MDDRVNDGCISARPPRRRGVPAYYFATIFAAALVLSLGIVLWTAARPGRLVKRSEAIGPEHVAVDIAYPADWSATDMSSLGQTVDGAPWIAGVDLSRKLPTGIQKWTEEHFFRSSEKDWRLSVVRVQLTTINGYRDIDTEAARMQPVLRQLVRRGGTFTMRKESCPAGDVLVVDVEGSANAGLGKYHSAFYLIHPPAGPGDKQYEVAVRYTAPRILNESVNKVARDVVSHMRVVRNSDKP